jgi:hypothetical protein
MPAEARHLQVSGVFSDIRVVERAAGMGFFQRTVVEDVVEDHRDAQCADLDNLRRFVSQYEPKNEFS